MHLDGEISPYIGAFFYFRKLILNFRNYKTIMFSMYKRILTYIISWILLLNFLLTFLITLGKLEEDITGLV